jgi:hypothetical protein
MHVDQNGGVRSGAQGTEATGQRGARHSTNQIARPQLLIDLLGKMSRTTQQGPPQNTPSQAHTRPKSAGHGPDAAYHGHPRGSSHRAPSCPVVIAHPAHPRVQSPMHTSDFSLLFPRLRTSVKIFLAFFFTASGLRLDHNVIHRTVEQTCRRAVVWPRHQMTISCKGITPWATGSTTNPVENGHVFDSLWEGFGTSACHISNLFNLQRR